MFIYFDLGNVLLHFNHDVACQQMAALTGLTADIVRQVVFDSRLEWAYERGDLSSQEFYERFCTDTACRPEFAALCRAASDIFAANERILPVVRALHQSGHRLGILSNTCEAHWQHCLSAFPDLGRMFQVHALSFRLRSMKPEPAIYQAAAKLAGVAATEEIFFTDDRRENVAAALSAGYDAVLFQSADQLVEDLRMRGLHVPL
jgi:putative hydrolase of the HAD superfamily